MLRYHQLREKLNIDIQQLMMDQLRETYYHQSDDDDAQLYHLHGCGYRYCHDEVLNHDHDYMLHRDDGQDDEDDEDDDDGHDYQLLQGGFDKQRDEYEQQRFRCYPGNMAAHKDIHMQGSGKQEGHMQDVDALGKMEGSYQSKVLAALQQEKDNAQAGVPELEDVYTHEDDGEKREDGLVYEHGDVNKDYHSLNY